VLLAVVLWCAQGRLTAEFFRRAGKRHANSTRMLTRSLAPKKPSNAFPMRMKSSLMTRSAPYTTGAPALAPCSFSPFHASAAPSLSACWMRRYGEAGLKGSMGGGGPDMSGFNNPFDLFEQFFGASVGGRGGFGGGFGGMGGRTRAVQGEDEKYEMVIDFNDAVFGCRCAASRCSLLLDWCIEQSAGWP